MEPTNTVIPPALPFLSLESPVLLVIILIGTNEVFHKITC